MKLLRWSEIPCNLATNNLDQAGYSRIHIDGKTVGAHRYALEQKLGRALREGYETCHHCDVRNCVEPEHLYEGTHVQNVREAHRKGRKIVNRNWVEHNLTKTHCPKGHPYSGDNLRHYRGQRVCKECDRLRARERYLRGKL